MNGEAKRRRLRWLALSAGLAVLSPLAAQSTDETGVYFYSPDTLMCENNGELEYTIVLKNMPVGKELTVQFSDGFQGNGVTLQLDGSNNRCINRTITSSKYHHDPEKGVRYVSFTLTNATLSVDSDPTHNTQIPILEPTTRTYRIYGKPSAVGSGNDLVGIRDLRADAAGNIDECGGSVTLQAADGWKDVSNYVWTSSNPAVVFTSSGTEATLSGGDVKLTDAVSTTVTLSQTVAGIEGCGDVASTEIRMLGEPEASLAPTEQQANEPILICSSLPAGADGYWPFEGVIDARGNTPITVTLSTGDVYQIEQSGDFQFDNESDAEPNHKGHVNRPGDISISEVVDANGCRSQTEAPGVIPVYDRKPHPDFAADSLVVEQPEGTLELQGATAGACVRWGATSDAERFGATINADGSEECQANVATVSSTINGTATFWVIEVDQTADVDCPSDTSFVQATWNLPLRYPNAFSPNGDGKNDKLVIEGLPERNYVMLLDCRGKKVFEAQDYRNDWTADGVDDGYYVLIFKGDGLKAKRETIAIKRTRNE